VCDVEFNVLVFLKSFDTFSLDRRDVYENIVAVFTLNKTNTFFCVKPFNFTSHHSELPPLQISCKVIEFQTLLHLFVKRVSKVIRVSISFCYLSQYYALNKIASFFINFLLIYLIFSLENPLNHDYNKISEFYTFFK